MRRRSSARPPPPMLRRALYLLRWRLYRLYAVCVRLCALVGGRVGTCVVVGGCLVCASGRSVGGSHDVALFYNTTYHGSTHYPLNVGKAKYHHGYYRRE